MRIKNEEQRMRKENPVGRCMICVISLSKRKLSLLLKEATGHKVYRCTLES